MSDQNFKIIKSMKCLVCGSPHVDVAHVKTRGSGGNDNLWNLMPLCRRDHSLQHSMGIISFSQKYISVSTYLQDNGWDLVNGKLLHIQDDQIKFPVGEP